MRKPARAPYGSTEPGLKGGAMPDMTKDRELEKQQWMLRMQLTGRA
jgi:hypothetical protein